MVKCASCLRVFTHSGYAHHVQHTRNDNCVAEFHAQIIRADNRNGVEEWDNDEYMEDNECMDNDDKCVDDDDGDYEFAGDFFGNYQTQDFEQPFEGERSRYSIKSMYCIIATNNY